jgi:hydroxysqualene synthase
MQINDQPSDCCFDLSPGTKELDASLNYCRNFLEHYENFTVAGILFPGELKPAIYAVYAFSRFSDDLADEAPPEPLKDCQENRLRRLEHWISKTENLQDSFRDHPILHSLHHAIEKYSLDLNDFLDLLSAFKQDLLVSEYADFATLHDYCRRSANPVGRIMLRLYSYHDGHSISQKEFELSDKICTGLQLANFWQDLSRDLKNNRLYIPKDQLRAHNLPLNAKGLLSSGTKINPLLEELCQSTEGMLREGLSLYKFLSFRNACEVQLFAAGGLAIIEKTRLKRELILASRPVISKLAKLQIAFKVLINLVFGFRNTG